MLDVYFNIRVVKEYLTGLLKILLFVDLYFLFVLGKEKKKNFKKLNLWV